MLIGVGNMLINVVLGRQTEQAIAAVAVFRTMEGLVIAFFSGFSNAASVLVGKEVGAGNHETAFQRAKRLVYLCSGIIGVACLVLLLLHNPLLHTLGLSGESYRIGTGMLIIYSVAAIIRMGNWAQNDTYRSAGDAAFGSILEITFMYLMVLPFVYLSNFYFHVPFLLCLLSATSMSHPVHPHAAASLLRKMDPSRIRAGPWPRLRSFENNMESR